MTLLNGPSKVLEFFLTPNHSELGKFAEKDSCLKVGTPVPDLVIFLPPGNKNDQHLSSVRIGTGRGTIHKYRSNIFVKMVRNMKT